MNIICLKDYVTQNIGYTMVKIPIMCSAKISLQDVPKFDDPIGKG